MKLVLNLIQRIWWVGAIFVLVVAIAFTNHIPNTTLSGWDTLHPEFDLAGYTSRVINGAWQQHQGLGAPPSQAHAAELVRIPILWLMSLLMPLNLIRYVFLFLMIYIGCIGIAVFVNSLFIGKSKSNFPGFIAAVFYLLSLVGVQQFYVPLEMFAIHYAVVPWLMLCLYKLTAEGEGKWTLWFVTLSILGAPQAHTATLYYVLIALMGIFVVIMAIGSWSTQKFKRGVVAIILGIVVNLYWIGPNIFYLLTRGQEVAQSKIHYEFTPEAILQNQAYGKIEDIAIGRNFLFNWFDYSFSEQKFLPLLDLWQINFESQGVSIIMYSFAAFALIALLLVAIKKGSYSALGWSSLVLLGTTVFFLINENPPTGFIFKYLIEKFPIIGEGLRFPFTKFSIFYLFLMAVGFGVGIKYLFSAIKWKSLHFIIVLGMLFCFGFVYKPAFMGGYVSRNMQVEIPREYSKLFEFMRTQDIDARVALMPAPNYWGWTYNDWTKYGYINGYQGAGFLWFGLRQPLLNREFDRWSKYNEDFYHNFSNAIYQEKSVDIGNVLQKYDVRYVLLDESVIAPGQGKEILRIEETKKIVEELGWEQKFQEGFLSVWEIPSNPVSNFISAPSEYSFVEADTSKVRQDVAFEQLGTYVSTNRETPPAFGVPSLPSTTTPVEESPVITYPFANLMREEVKGVEYGKGKVTISYEETPPAFGVPTRDSLEAPVEESPQLIVPGWKIGDIVRIQYKEGVPVPVYFVNGKPGPIFLGKEKPEEGKDIIYAKVSEGKEWSEYLVEHKYDLQGQTLKIEVPSVPQVYDFGTMGQGKLGNCDVLKRGVAEKLGTSYIADGRGAACDYIEMTEIDPRMSYLMRFQGNNIEGRSLKYFLYNTGSKRNDIEYLLGKNKYDQTFSLLPWAWDGNYTLNIETRSFGQRAENLVQPIEVRWFPLEQMAGAKIIPSRSDLVGFENDLQPTRSDLRVTEVTKTGTWLYRVKVEGSGLLKLSQGYDDGWVSPGLTHVKVDGWANGWIVPQSGEATIFYWPQLLEYLGFVILGTTIVLVVFRKK
jgi:hypothetical protein